jgi:uncharacterized protein
VYRYLRDHLGARHLQFIPVVERATAADLPLVEGGWKAPGERRLLYRQRGEAVTERSVTAHGWGEFLVAVFDEWVVRDVGEVFVQHFDTLLGNRFGEHSVCVHAPICGSAVAIEHNGDVYSCDHYVEPGYHLGNVTDTRLATMVASPFQRRFGQAKSDSLPGQCVRCRVRWACHGGCPKDRFRAADDGQSGLNYLCPGYDRFFTHAWPAIDEMATLLAAGQPADLIMTGHQATRLTDHQSTRHVPFDTEEDR